MDAPLSARESKPLQGGPSFSLLNRVYRAFWTLAWLLLASWTPPVMHRWRRMLLRAFGAKMAPGSDVRASARVWSPRNLTMEKDTLIAAGVNCYNMAPVSMGEGALVSQKAVLCAGSHRIDDLEFQLITKPIVLKARSWIATEAFVAPGVIVGEGAVLGARAVALDNLDEWTLYVGNPAVPKRKRKQQ
jgi:putative colanic acid biosynthesis acetyltransferase WcaF